MELIGGGVVRVRESMQLVNLGLLRSDMDHPAKLLLSVSCFAPQKASIAQDSRLHLLITNPVFGPLIAGKSSIWTSHCREI